MTQLMAAPEHAATAEPLAIEVRGLTMSYGSRQVLRGVDFEVRPGEVFRGPQCRVGVSARQRELPAGGDHVGHLRSDVQCAALAVGRRRTAPGARARADPATGLHAGRARPGQ